MNRTPEARYTWEEIVRLSGAEGSRWVDDFGRCAAVTKPLERAVTCLRLRGALAEADAALATAREGIAALEGADGALCAVLQRQYCGALGYYHYWRGEFDEADHVMQQGYGVMVDAIRQRRFLLAMADEAVDLRLHRARIARNRHRWAEMRMHLDAAWAMREGELPYYVLPDGTSIGIVHVTEFLDSLPVPEAMRPLVPRLQDAEHRRRDTDRHIREIVRLPGLVIQYL